MVIKPGMIIAWPTYTLSGVSQFNNSDYFKVLEVNSKGPTKVVMFKKCDKIDTSGIIGQVYTNVNGWNKDMLKVIPLVERNIPWL